MKSYPSVLNKLESLKAWYGSMGEYCEPGYDSTGKLVLFGNWNYLKDGKLAEAIEEHFELAWEDEWIMCDGCFKYFRCVGDCYQWTMYGEIMDGECLCADCIKENPEEYIGSLLNNPKSCAKDWIDLRTIGFRNMNGTFENGWHPGQTDDPVTILKEYREKYPTMDFVFGNLGSSQFYLTFEIWGKEHA